MFGFASILKRLLLNILAKLKICCENRDKGCNEVLLLDNLNNHIKSCRFKKELCKQCKCEIFDGHNCVKCLLEVNAKLADKLKSASIRIESLEKENEKYLQTIRDLTNTNPINSNNSFRVREFHSNVFCFVQKY